MPHKSIRQILSEAERRRSTDRYLECCLAVLDHKGVEVIRVGGRWDGRLKRYAGSCAPHFVHLTEAQSEEGNDIARAFAEMVLAIVRGDKERVRVLMAGGNRGSGKTHLLGGVAVVLVALQWPNEVQLVVNANSENRTEIIKQIEKVAPAEWVRAQSNDLRDPWLEFVTGNRVKFLSAQNPKRLRVGGLTIRHVLLNEAQEMSALNYESAIGTSFRMGGFVTVATNPPRSDSTDWVAHVWNGIESGESAHRGKVYRLKNKLNDRVDQVGIDDMGVMLRLSSQEAADADAGGEMKLSGPIAYKNFKPLPLHLGGHIGDPPPRPLFGAPPWRDVTREKTAELMGGGEGYGAIIGSDFQRRPGIVGVDCRFYEVVQPWEEGPRVAVNPADPGGPTMALPVGTLVMWACAQINCPGDESAYSEALNRAGYTPDGGVLNGRQTIRALLVGDGTGARQNSAHNWELPPSFKWLKQEGWAVVPPRWTRKRKPDNPTVRESRAQIWDGFEKHQLLVSPALKANEGGFYSLISSLKRAKVNEKGSLVGSNHHAPDGWRYVWFLFGPQPTPPRSDGLDDSQFNALRSIRVLTSE